MPRGLRVLPVTRRLLAGVLLVNAVPHGVKGVSGERFPTPFADPPGVGLSAPVHNVAWSAVNLLGGALLIGRSRVPTHERLATAAGGAAMAFFLAHYFGRLDTTDPGAGRGLTDART